MFKWLWSTIRRSIMKRAARRKSRVQVRYEPAPRLDAAQAIWGLCACAIVKNEGPYIREWIEFHLLQGVEHFFIYDNGSNDSTLDILQEYEKAGTVDVIPWPGFSPVLNAQFCAYAHCAHMCVETVEWLAFIDVDEFLFSDSSDDVYGELMSVAGPDVSAVGVCRYEYGPCGHDEKPEGLVIENYTQRVDVGAEAKVKIKTIARPGGVVEVASAHYMGIAGGDFINPSGGVLASRKVRGVSECRGGLRINHYYTKSRSEFIEKLSRGRMVPKPHWQQKAKEKMIEFEVSDSVHDESILRFVPAVRSRCELL